jgi:phosphate transport system substrate-binding protein
MSLKKLLGFALVVLCSCQSKENAEEKGTPVSGTFKLITDKAFYPVAVVLSNAFCSNYPEVVITIDTLNSSKAILSMGEGTCSAFISGKPISTTDSLALVSRKKFFKQFHFGSDAVAFIANAADSAILATSSVRKLLQNCTFDSTFKIVTTESGSEENYLIRATLPEAENCMPSWHSFSNTPDVINYVINSKGTIGIVSWAYLSENQSREIQKLKEKLVILPITNTTADSVLRYPDQSSLVESNYPLTRKMYLTTSEPYSGPAHGFASYVASDEGQRVLRLFGLAPFKMPVREVQITQ